MNALLDVKILFYILSRIPVGMKMTTLSPQKVIVDSLSSIPPKATELILTVNDMKDLDELRSHLSFTLTTFTTNNFCGSVHKLPPNLTCLVTDHKFNLPVDNLLQDLLT
jgi:hypothetical protein